LSWVEDRYHQAIHGTLNMKPVDRFGLDLSRLRYRQPSPFNREIFYIEQSRSVRADNTFQIHGIRYEAPRDLRHLTIQVRYDRSDTSSPPIVYHDGERMGTAEVLNRLLNDRGRQFDPLEEGPITESNNLTSDEENTSS
ncbi:MAG: hypothetical protein AAF226_13715, partial [Verrucomicrobiota bacterium]